jgi:GNAT superfamily N-acetyltransferase
VSVVVHAVEVGGAYWDAFLEVPVGSEIRPALYSADALAALLSGNLPLAAGLSTQAFVALRDGAPVGRVVMQIDPRFPEMQVCHFGFFSCIDDVDVAHQLMLAMTSWARAHGMRNIDGPIDINIFVGYRTQTCGFATVPLTGEPRSPAHHRTLLEQVGFSPSHLYRTFAFDRPRIEQIVEYLQKKLAKHADELDGYTISSYDHTDLVGEIKAIYPLVMETFGENYGAVQLSAEEFRSLYEPIANILSIEASVKILKDGEPVGFSMAYFEPTDHGALIGHSFGLKKLHRKAGLAYAILERAFATSLRKGCHSFYGAFAKDGPVVYEHFVPAARVYTVFRRHV